MAAFAELGLSQPTLESLAHLGYGRPTPIQEQAIPPLLEGRDVIGQAQTGTGKTAAFGLPMIEYADPEEPEVQALVLTPTRELCIQVTQALRAYGERSGLEVVAVFGGAPIRDQAARLGRGAQVVVGTVGRVLDMIQRHHLYLDGARYVVLDEADEMLDLGFLEDVETILRRCPMGRQTALFSATVPPEIRRLADTFMHDPVEIRARAATLTIDTVDQFYVEVPDREKPQALVHVLREERPRQAIVFARTKIGVDRLARRMGDAGVRVRALHGDMSRPARRGDDRLQVRSRAAARRHRRGCARPRHHRRQSRGELRHPEFARRLRASNRAHRPRRRERSGGHADHPQAEARAGGDRAPREDRARRVVPGTDPGGAA